MEQRSLPAGERILLTGSTGQVGGELWKVLRSLGEVVAPARDVMDLADADSIRDTIRAVRPRWIVNPAAYTAVDRAEIEPELAYAINAEAVRVMAKEAQSLGAGLIHFSTDYVFDGSGTVPYVETDATGPVCVYGASKLAGEQAVVSSDAGHILFRTSWVYGSAGKNFLLTILKLARDRETVRIVSDQHGAPTWSRDLARMTTAVVGSCEAAAQRVPLVEALRELSGVYHAAGGGETSWFGFADEAVRLQRLREPGTRLATIEAISTDQFPTPARRPANSRLDCRKLKERFSWKMMDWRDSLKEVLAEI